VIFSPFARRAGLTLLAAGLATPTGIALLSPAAFAHVTVNPSSAAQGGYAKLTFRVPNERPAAGTTKLEVQFPADAPLQSASVQPTPGWTYTVDKGPLPQPVQTESGTVTEGVTKITWSGSVIKPGEFQEFSISVGPLPKNRTAMTFKALQTYEGGEVVRWIEERTPGGAEPKSPAPVLTLTPAVSSTTAATTTVPSATTLAAATSMAATTAAATIPPASMAPSGVGDDDTGDDGASNGLAIAALAVGSLGLVAGAGALVVARRRR